MRSQAKFILLTAVISILGTASVSLPAPRVIYVDDDATGANTGSSWANAYRYLQDALADANAADKPVEVRIAQGTYSPDLGKQVVRGDYLASFRITDGIVIKGGFVGVTGSDPNLRDPHVYRTILTGDLARDDVPMADAWSSYRDPSKNDNSSCIILVEQAGSDTLLEGVVVTAAFPGLPESRNIPPYPCGLYAGRDTSLTIRDCTFIENLTSGIGCLASNLTVVDCLFENNFEPIGGGGMWISGGNPRIVGCTFKRNQGVGGGGIGSAQSTLWLEDCKFKDNTAFEVFDGSFGGGLYCWGGRGESTLLRCEFEGNTADEGGGAYLVAPFTVKDCTFRRNHVLISGGALSHFSKVDIQGCVFSGNSAREGGAIFTRAGQGDLTQCLFSGNVARSGGACIYATGPEFVVPSGRGERYRVYFHLTLTNCTTADNIAPLGRTIQCVSYSGGSPDTGTLRASNCIFDNGANEIHPRRSQISISYTNLRGGRNAVYDPCVAVSWGEGNIDVDSGFGKRGYWTDPDDPNYPGDPNDPNAIWVDGDYHLKSQGGRWDSGSLTWIKDDETSLCIDAGDPNSPVADEPQPNGGQINLGAYGGTAEASKSP